jgi:SAM-dependent methyltransferase
MTDAVTEVNARVKTVWSGGDWDAVAHYIAEVGPALLARLGPLDGRDLLDVGTGSGGSVAIPAALEGARVVGSDITDRWFEAGRRRAEAAGVEIEWVEANVEDLPFPDASFDLVASTFGHMFAPRHAVAAAEMARVCRPGGTVATATWIPDGFVGEMFALLGEFMPKPPDFVQPPGLWGVREHVEAVFEPHGMRLEFDEGEVVFREESIDAYVEFFERTFGPMVAARAVLGDRFADLDARFRELIAQHNRAEAGLEFVQRYLVTLARRP